MDYSNTPVTYSFKTGLGKAVKYSIIFLLPQLVDIFIVNYPELAQLSVGGLLILLVNYLKVKKGFRL